MSMHDDAAGSARRPWPMSRTNAALVAMCAAGALICFVFGQTVAAVALLIGAVGGGLGAVLARRGSAGDLERVNALEYADERDRVAGTKGLAAVGVVALVLGTVQLVVHAVVDTDPVSRWTAIVFYFALVISWFVANWYFVRRG
ncbi:hypothetical protein FVO59_07070 [Microbacterium esteraromaticum]|uniref:DUF2178 domain-containing protein n=1 Tax=Microbacterium esteraromaticum TaxID=57043 RepID=A0A7D7WFN3_9MICO|nr:hypothetical protein [Microbacterium esteraromaticum]QMU97011.1 hypothetical protein FVO59_07070 [Microbacterium esteraromaticum]